MDTGEAGSGSFAMRISLNPDGTPADISEAPAIIDLEALMAAPSSDASEQAEEDSIEEAASAMQVKHDHISQRCVWPSVDVNYSHMLIEARRIYRTQETPLAQVSFRREESMKIWEGRLLGLAVLIDARRIKRA